MSAELAFLDTGIARVEAAIASDAPGIAAIHVASWQAAYAGLLPDAYLAGLSLAEREAAWKARLERGARPLLVARREGRLLGFVAVGPSRDAGAAADCAEVEALYLDPEAWSQGIGRLLLAAALQQLLDAGFTTVTLWVFAGNERALCFYRAMGFRPEDGVLQAFTLGDTTLQELRLVRPAD